MLAIAQAESGCNPEAVNTSNSDGSTDTGLMQINSIHGVPMEELKNLSPIQRAVEVHEVADTVAFLASVSAGAINGQVLNVDGGLTIMSTR